jgi:hypothetical protein
MFAYEGTQAFPANLTPDDDTGLGAWTEQQVTTALLDGQDDKGRPLCSAMPKYRDLGMTDEQAREIAAYLRSLAPVVSNIPETTSCRVGGT